LNQNYTTYQNYAENSSMMSNAKKCKKISDQPT